MKRWYIVFIIIGGLLGGCSSSSGPGEESTDPPMKPMSTEINAPESVLLGEDAQYEAECSTDDGILRMEMSYDGPSHSFTKVLENPGTTASIDTILAHTQAGTVTIDALCENNYEFGPNQQRRENGATTVRSPEPVEYTQTSFTMEQYETIRLNLQDFIQSAVEVDSTNASTNSNQLQITRIDSDIYEFTSPQAGQHDFELFAQNVDKSTTETDAVMNVQSVEPIQVYVQNNDTDKHTNGLVAHLGVYDSQGTRLDTLSSSNGRFEIPRSDAIEFIRARYTKNGDAFSFVRTDKDIVATMASADTEHITRVVDYYLRDKDGDIRGELKPSARKIESPEGFRKWVVEGALDAVGSFNGDRSVPGTLAGTFNCYTESKNGRGPDELLLTDVFHRLNNGDTSYLTQRVKNIIKDEYNSNIAPWIGEFALDLKEVDRIDYDSENNKFANISFFAPQSHPAFGELGRVYVFGEEPNTVLNASGWIRSLENGGAKDDQIRYAVNQEGFAALAFMSRTPADDWADENQSIVHNSSSLLKPSLMDGKLTRANWEKTYGCADQQGNLRILYLNDVFGKAQ
ncbi:MAG: hypothetical protein GVY07_08750 [Bacteroidetes bacterium]|jgi:hypothetical protein|nr:hypothetical protein [Bacteroidota bacterium]